MDSNTEIVSARVKPSVRRELDELARLHGLKRQDIIRRGINLIIEELRTQPPLDVDRGGGGGGGGGDDDGDGDRTETALSAAPVDPDPVDEFFG